MRADDAADAVMDLPQDRSQPVLDLLPEPQRTKVLTLLGYNTATAGGLMSIDYLAVARTAHHRRRPRTRPGTATSQQPEALTTIYSLDPDGRLNGAISLVQRPAA